MLRDRVFSSLIEVFAPGMDREVVRHFLSMCVEAVVFVGHFHREEIEARSGELIARGTPHPVIDHFGLTNAHTVSLDRAAAMAGVVDHLPGLGHRRLGLPGIAKAPTSRHDRPTGIHAGLRTHGLASDACTVSLDPRHERHNDFDYGRKLAGNFSQLARRPTALLARNDEIAIGALRGWQEAGPKLPRDPSVTGFNDPPVAGMTPPPLRTVNQNIDTTIATAAETQLAQSDAPPWAKRDRANDHGRVGGGEATGPARPV